MAGPRTMDYDVCFAMWGEKVPKLPLRQKSLERANFRFWREPRFPWIVESGNLTATVSALERLLKPHPDAEERSWDLNIDLETGGQWRLLRVEAKNPAGVRVRNSRADEEAIEGKRRVDVQVTAPRRVRVPPNREPVTLLVTYQKGNETLTQEIDVDYRASVGDYIEKDDRCARGYAKVAQRYVDDPTIDQLVRRAEIFPKGTLKQEIDRLKRWLHYEHSRSYQEDPGDPFRSVGAHYALSPTETARYGGDCEDWAILTAAYLVRRGFDVWIAFTIGHVWTVAQDSDGREMAVDLASPDARMQVALPEVHFPDGPLGMVRIYKDASDIPVQ